MKLRIEASKDAKLPGYAHEGDAGLDLYSAEDCILKPCEIKAVSTGLKAAIPNGYVGLVWDKSGLALKGFHVIAGVIDSGYRGVISCVITNISRKDLEIKKHTKIAQLLIQPVAKVEVEETESLDETKRGSKGFGSTGLH